jgi:uncharacterized protein YpuA (DUF1002 family)
MERVDRFLADEAAKDLEKRLPAVWAQRKNRNQNVRQLMKDVAGKYGIRMTEEREDKLLDILARIAKRHKPTANDFKFFGFVFHGLEVKMSPEEKVARRFMVHG